MDYDKELVNRFWGKFRNSLPVNQQNTLSEKGPDDVWSFGDSSEMADDLLSYVLRGEKTTTSGMVQDYHANNEVIPKPGEKSVILNGKQEPTCIVEMVKVQIKKFKNIDEEYALKEGEGFKSLQDWRDLHWSFFTRRCKLLGIELTEDVELVCLEFKVIYTKSN